VSGAVLAIDRKGNVKTIAKGLGKGLNPIVVLRAPPAKAVAGPAAGFYLADTITKQVLFSPASGFAAFTGSVLVGTELTGQLWVIQPNASGGFDALAATTDLPDHPWNIEGSAYVP